MSINTEANWGKPILFEAERSEQLAPDCLPFPFRDMAQAIVESLGVAPEFPTAVMLGVGAVCCQTHTLEIKDGWTAPLSLNIVPVLAPGEKKSVVLNKVFKPVDDWVENWNTSHKDEIVQSSTRFKMLQKRRTALENAAAKDDKEAAIQLENVERELYDFKKVSPKILRVSDITPESLVSCMAEQGGSLAVISAEGGFINNICGLYSDKPNADAVCKAYDGDSIEVNRITRSGERISNPHLSMVQCVQPVIWQKLFTNKELRGVGLVDRCLMLAPETSIGKSRFDTPPIPDKIATHYHNVVTALLDMRDERRYISLSSAARKTFADFYDNFNLFHLGTDFQELQGWGAKICGTTARIAGILQLMENRNSSEVSEENMLRAISMSFYFQEQAKLIYGGSLLNQKSSLAEYVLSRIETLLKKGKYTSREDGNFYITYRDLSQSCNKQGLDSKEDYIKPLQVLQGREIIDIEDEKFSTILINPQLVERVKIC